MHLDDLEIIPLAAESFGVRSLCTFVRTPDVSILFDASAALARRYNLEPHPREYQELDSVLERIHSYAEQSDILSISHYHYDHIRPGFENYQYNICTKNERKEMFTGKIVYAKDNREDINNSQRRRGYYFMKDVKPVIGEIHWADSKSFQIGDTNITYSPPLPHGANNSPLGFVIATKVEYAGKCFLFAPDIQGPTSKETLAYILSVEPDLAIIGGPPLYLSQFTASEANSAFYSLSLLVATVPILVVDHHNMRGDNWNSWINPVRKTSIESGHQLLSMAELAERKELCLEFQRRHLYEDYPPSEEFLNWTNASEEYKVQNRPPI